MTRDTRIRQSFLKKNALYNPRQSSKTKNNSKIFSIYFQPCLTRVSKGVTSESIDFTGVLKLYTNLFWNYHLNISLPRSTEQRSAQVIPWVYPTWCRLELKDSIRFWFLLLIKKEGERLGNEATGASPKIADNIQHPFSNKVRSYRVNLPEPCK